MFDVQSSMFSPGRADHGPVALLVFDACGGLNVEHRSGKKSVTHARQFVGHGGKFFTDAGEENAGAVDGTGAGFAAGEEAERVLLGVQGEVLHFPGAEYFLTIGKRAAHALAEIADGGSVESAGELAAEGFGGAGDEDAAVDAGKCGEELADTRERKR